MGYRVLNVTVKSSLTSLYDRFLAEENEYWKYSYTVTKKNLAAFKNPIPPKVESVLLPI